MNRIFIKIILCFALAMSVTVSYAQDFKWGITAGANFNYPTQLVSSETSYQFGLKGEYSLGKRKSAPYATASLLYSRFPWFRVNYLYAEDEWESIGTDRANYAYEGLYLPVHIGYKLNVVENIKLFMNAGPYVSMKIGTASGHSLNINNSGYHIEDINMDKLLYAGLSGFTWGVGAEVGLELADKLQMQVSYNHGFTRMRDGKHEPLQNTLSVGMSWLF